MAFKANEEIRNIEQPIAKIDTFQLLSQARTEAIKNLVVEAIRNDAGNGKPLLLDHFRSRGPSPENNILTFVEKVLNGEKYISPFRTMQNIREDNVVQALNNLANEIKSLAQNEKALVSVTMALNSGNEREIALARALNLEQVQIALKAAIMAQALANAQKKKDASSSYSNPAYAGYFASLGTSREAAQAQAIKTKFGINQSHMASAAGNVALTINKLKGGIAEKFSKALSAVRSEFGLLSSLVPAKNDVPAAFKAALVHERIQKLLKEQEEKENQKQKQEDKRRKDRESKKQKTDLAKKKIKKQGKTPI